jgi:hypothetical protein
VAPARGPLIVIVPLLSKAAVFCSFTMISWRSYTSCSMCVKCVMCEVLYEGNLKKSVTVDFVCVDVVMRLISLSFCTHVILYLYS